MATAHINIGSNIGDRRALIETAVARIIDAFPGPVGISSVIETEPWGFESPNRFLNIGLTVETRQTTPENVFATLRAIQNAISDASHRRPDGSYADRAVDIDLIAVGDLVVDSPPDLILPHPRMHLRPFVLIPMLELQPEWVHPLLGLTPRQMLESTAPSR